MIFRLLMFCAQLGAREHIAPATIAAVAIETRAVVLDDGPLPGLDALQSAQLIDRWTYGESRWRTDVGNGGSWGLGQIGDAEIAAVLEVAAIPAWKTSMRLQLLGTLRYMRRLILDCGSLVGGLGAYASGKCGGARALVLQRLRDAEIEL